MSRQGRADPPDHRFWAENPCEATFEVTRGEETVLQVCGRHWCNRDEAGGVICQYCDAPRADALPEGAAATLRGQAKEGAK